MGNEAIAMQAATRARTRPERGKDAYDGDSVLALLQKLRARISRSSGGGLRAITGLYGRLLAHASRDLVEDGEATVVQELSRIRQMMKEDVVDLLDVVETMDGVADRCLALAGQDATVLQTLRLLVALAGGSDGCSFVLADPTRVSDEATVTTVQRRIGDRVRMDNIEMATQWQALFNRQCIPLHDDDIRPTCIMDAVGLGLPAHRKSLWSAVEDSATQQSSSNESGSNQFMMIDAEEEQPGEAKLFGALHRKFAAFRTDSDRTHDEHQSPHYAFQGEDKLKNCATADVFFWDGTQEIKADWKRTEIVDDATSMTESSSSGVSSCDDVSELWSLPRSSAWESVGDQERVPFEHQHKLETFGPSQSLIETKIPIDVACRYSRGGPIAEVHETDIVEDALLALRGMDSTLLRRDVRSATFVLPSRHQILVHRATLTSTANVLESFRYAGSMFIRLEFLGVYYSQDPARGGKTLQAFGSALLSYLHALQASVEKLTRAMRNSKDATHRITTVPRLLTQTRCIRTMLDGIGKALGCDCDDFWPLIVKRTFPRGVQLLNFLYDRMKTMQMSDVGGDASSVMLWLLQSACSPFLEVLSDITATGFVAMTTDPHSEFELSHWTNKVAESSGYAGGSKLFDSRYDLDDATVDQMFPSFLQGVAASIPYLSRLQQVSRALQSQNGMKYDLFQLHINSHDAVKCWTRWEEKRYKSEEPADEEITDRGTASNNEVESICPPVIGDRDEEPLLADTLTTEVDDTSSTQNVERVVMNDDGDVDMTTTAQSALPESVEEMDTNRDMSDRVQEAESMSDCTDTNEALQIENEHSKQLQADYRPSVKVNKTAGSRNAGIFATAGADTAEKHTRRQIRVIREPGGGGDAAYDCLYNNVGDVNDVVQNVADENDCGNQEVGIQESRANESVEEDEPMMETETGHVKDVERSGLEPEPSESDDPGGVAAPHSESLAIASAASAASATTGDNSTLPSNTQSDAKTRFELPNIHPFFAFPTALPADIARLVREIEGTEPDFDQLVTPFEFLVDSCVVQPIKSAERDLDHSTLRALLTTTRLLDHLEWLRKLMLMCEGLCMDVFARDLLDGLRSPARVHWANAERLTMSLSLAMIEARFEPDPIAQQFRYRLSPALQGVLGSAMTTSAAVPRIVREMELVFDVEWPLGVVVSTQSLQQYASIHRFLLHVRLTVLELKDVWLLMREIERDGRLEIETRRALAEVLHRTQFVLRAFNESFSSAILMSAWDTLLGNLRTATSLVQVQQSHANYIETAAMCCFLDESSHEIHEAFASILGTAWRTTELARTLHRRATGFVQENAKVLALRHEHASGLQRLAAKLSGVGHDRPRSFREFAENLLVRIDYNNYYCAA